MMTCYVLFCCFFHFRFLLCKVFSFGFLSFPAVYLSMTNKPSLKSRKILPFIELQASYNLMFCAMLFCAILSCIAYSFAVYYYPFLHCGLQPYIRLYDTCNLLYLWHYAISCIALSCCFLFISVYFCNLVFFCFVFCLFAGSHETA